MSEHSRDHVVSPLQDTAFCAWNKTPTWCLGSYSFYLILEKLQLETGWKNIEPSPCHSEIRDREGVWLCCPGWSRIPVLRDPGPSPSVQMCALLPQGVR